MFFETSVDKKKNNVIFDNFPNKQTKNISVTYECIRFVDSYRFLSSSLDSLVKTPVDSINKTLKDFEEEVVDIDEILSIVMEIKSLIKEEKFRNDSNEGL